MRKKGCPVIKGDKSDESMFKLEVLTVLEHRRKDTQYED